MKKFSKITTCAMLLVIIAACEQKITQQVVLDTALLESLTGKSKSSSNPSALPSTSPNPRISPSQPSETPQPSEQSVGSPLQAIRDNAQNLNTRNFNGYLNTFDLSVFSADVLAQLWAALTDANTIYEIFDLQIQSQTQTQASVLVDIDITDFGGTIEKSFLYTLGKSDANWKITNIQFLDPNEFIDDDF